MGPLRAILVATDFSDDARNAALRGAMLAREHGARGVLLHVVPDLPLEAQLRLVATGAIEHALERLIADLGFPFEPRLEIGPAGATIASAAAGFDLVVAGARGLHPLRDFVLGTTAQRLLRKSPAPVLIVKNAPERAYRQALVPVDFSDDSLAALTLAARLAPGAELNVLHAFEAPFESTLRLAGVPEAEIERHRAQARDAARETMDRMLAAAALGEARTTRIFEHGYASTLISEAEDRIGADLLAIGKHGKGALEELLLGSVTLHALAAARCDVLMVPARRA